MDGNAKCGVKQSRRYPERTEPQQCQQQDHSQTRVWWYYCSQSRRTTGPLTRLTGKVGRRGRGRESEFSGSPRLRKSFSRGTEWSTMLSGLQEHAFLACSSREAPEGKQGWQVPMGKPFTTKTEPQKGSVGSSVHVPGNAFSCTGLYFHSRSSLFRPGWTNRKRPTWPSGASSTVRTATVPGATSTCKAEREATFFLSIPFDLPPFFPPTLPHALTFFLEFFPPPPSSSESSLSFPPQCKHAAKEREGKDAAGRRYRRKQVSKVSANTILVCDSNAALEILAGPRPRPPSGPSLSLPLPLHEHEHEHSATRHPAASIAS